ISGQVAPEVIDSFLTHGRDFSPDFTLAGDVQKQPSTAKTFLFGHNLEIGQLPWTGGHRQKRSLNQTTSRLSEYRPAKVTAGKVFRKTPGLQSSQTVALLLLEAQGIKNRIKTLIFTCGFRINTLYSISE
ncbi:hypothetical protein, partial [Armatimonas sp.]|uniref:hypothetical protein n=1 Tax=Armatimonas sp. TaxID=1872638 RepID=UPI00286BF68A